MNNLEVVQPPAGAEADVSVLSTASPRQPLGQIGPVLDGITALLDKYVTFPKESQCIAAALWTVHTWIYDLFRYTPYLHIYSPEKRCGKSVLLDCIGMIVARPAKIDNMSEAGLFHIAQEERATMLWDEVDNVFVDDKTNAPIIGLLNAGFKRGGTAIRVPKGKLTRYDVFVPKVLCGIGKIPDTTHDRCIDIRLSRAKAKTIFREEDAEPEVGPLRAELEKWSQQVRVTPGATRIKVKFPSEIDDGRKRDIIEPLLVIAELAGPAWADKGREALRDLCMNIEDTSTGIQLLCDLRDIFINKNTPRCSSQELLDALIKVEKANSPWPVWWESDIRRGNTGKPAKELAEYLEGYGIKPTQFRINGERIRGYEKADFADAWKRYLPPVEKAKNMELELLDL